MARGMALAAVVVVVVLVGGTSAFFPYGYGTPLMFLPPGYHNSPDYYNAPDYYDAFPYSVSAGTIQAIRIAVDRSLPCPAQGFYANPSNCSQFYRCVDHIGTGQWFVRYVFECPAGHSFAAQVATCLPGPCDGTQTPVSPVSPVTPLQPITPMQPVVTPSPEPSTDAPTEVTTMQPGEVEGDTQTPDDGASSPEPTEAPQPQTEAPQPPQQPDPNCIGQYLQHGEFCNVYIRCNETGQRYICPPGTVFDEPRQMCRISAGDESLCVGKMVADFPFFLRTEIIDGHLLLPDSFVLTPVNPFNPQTLPLNAPPFQNKPLLPPIPGSVPVKSPLSPRPPNTPFSQSPSGSFPGGSSSLSIPPNPSFSPSPSGSVNANPPPLSLRAPNSPFSSSPSGSPSIPSSYPGVGSSSPHRSPNTPFSNLESPIPPSPFAFRPSGKPFPANTPSLTYTEGHSSFSPFSPLPADTQRLPTFPRQSLSPFRPQPFYSPYSLPPEDPFSPNNVRRPLNHLHFPYFDGFIRR